MYSRCQYTEITSGSFRHLLAAAAVAAAAAADTTTSVCWPASLRYYIARVEEIHHIVPRTSVTCQHLRRRPAINNGRQLVSAVV